MVRLGCPGAPSQEKMYMADPIIISASIIDAAGKRKTSVLFVPNDLLLADVQTIVTDWTPKLDAAIDGKIVLAQAVFPFTLPSGLKSAPVDGNRVREGALLSFSADGTFHKYSSYVPSWENAGFVTDSDVVLNTGVYATLINYMVANTSNDDAEALTAYLEGERAFRK